jgi:hypothetical protein
MVAPFQWPMPCTNCIGPITPILISCAKATAKNDTANKKTIVNMKISLFHLSILKPSFLEIFQKSGEWVKVKATKPVSVIG